MSIRGWVWGASSLGRGAQAQPPVAAPISPSPGEGVACRSPPRPGSWLCFGVPLEGAALPSRELGGSWAGGFPPLSGLRPGGGGAEFLSLPGGTVQAVDLRPQLCARASSSGRPGRPCHLHPEPPRPWHQRGRLLPDHPAPEPAGPQVGSAPGGDRGWAHPWEPPTPLWHHAGDRLGGAAPRGRDVPWGRTGPASTLSALRASAGEWVTAGASPAAFPCLPGPSLTGQTLGETEACPLFLRSLTTHPPAPRYLRLSGFLGPQCGCTWEVHRHCQHHGGDAGAGAGGGAGPGAAAAHRPAVRRGDREPGEGLGLGGRSLEPSGEGHGGVPGAPQTH